MKLALVAPQRDEAKRPTVRKQFYKGTIIGRPEGKLAHRRPLYEQRYGRIVALVAQAVHEPTGGYFIAELCKDTVIGRSEGQVCNCMNKVMQGDCHWSSRGRSSQYKPIL